MSSRICLPTIYDKIYKASMFCFQNYVFTMVRMLDVDFTSICTWGLHRHLNVECFALAVPWNFVSYAPTFFKPTLKTPQSVRALCMLRLGVQIPTETNQDVKKVVKARTPNARRQVRVSRVFEDDQYKRMPVSQ